MYGGMKQMHPKIDYSKNYVTSVEIHAGVAKSVPGALLQVDLPKSLSAASCTKEYASIGFANTA